MSVSFRLSLLMLAELAAGSAVIAAPGFDHLELTAVTGVADTTYVCVLEPGSGYGRWLTIGVEQSGLLAERYDSEQNAVLIRANGQARWFKMRRSEIWSVPVARNADGTVDWIHMKMTGREKEQEAQAMVGDILNVSFLGRSGLLGPVQQANTSQPR